MKRVAPAAFSAPPGARSRTSGWGVTGTSAREVAQPRPGQFTVKVLLASNEASAVLGPGGSVCRDIGQQTQCKLHVSGRQEYYPNTQLQELSVRGQTADTVFTALLQALAKIIEDVGKISGGDPDVAGEDSRVRVVVPSMVARAVIGRGGENIKNVRQSCGIHVHIDEVAIGMGDLAEQTIQMQGPFPSVQMGLQNIVEKMMEGLDQPWFLSWASVSHAGSHSVEVSQVAPGKGKGKGKGKPMGKGMDPGSPWGADQMSAGGWGDQGWGAAPGPMSSPAATPRGFGGGPSPSQSGMDMLGSALSALPASAADLMSRSHSASWTCPAHCVSAVIGRGGSGTKEIAMATGAKVMIRDIDGNPQEKSVTAVGSAPGVAAAYMMVIARITSAQEQYGGGGGGARPGYGGVNGGLTNGGAGMGSAEEAELFAELMQPQEASWQA